MKYIWIEILKFLKNNLIKIIVGTLLIATLFTGWTIFTLEEPEEEVLVAEAPPVNFHFYIEDIDEDVFTNNSLMDQYVTLPKILQTASDATNTKLSEVVEETENTALVNYKESGYTNIIGVTKNNSSVLHEFYVNVGNEENNMAIAEYYFNLFTEGEIPFLEDKTVYVFQGPEIEEFDEVDSFNVTAIEEINIVQTVIVGIIFGGIVTIGILVLLSFLTKKLHYFFSYTLKADDYFVLIDEKFNNLSEMNQLLTSYTKNNNVVITQNTEKSHNNNYNNLMKELSDKTSFEKYNSVFEIPNFINIDQIIYVVEEGSTSRAWYEKQRKYDNLFGLPTIVIQVNKH